MRILFIIFFILINGQVFGQDTLLKETFLPIEIRESRDQEREVIRLQRNHFLSYPASFDDPSRLLMKFSGVSVLNDQSNFVIYRGLPPHYTKWSINGAEVVNPNHLSNTGTISDRSSRSAGGVNMLSGQVIGKMDYLNPSSMDHIGNAAAGISDITFRKSYRDQYFLNVGLIGLEAGMERTSDHNDFLLNYRYSTLGVLSAMGVDLGDETIGFQDLTSSFTLNDKLGGDLTFYGSWGKSSNDHDALKEMSDFTEIKDLQDIYYNNTIALLGVNFNKKDDNNSLNITFNFSNKSENRESNKGESVILDIPIYQDSFTLDESIFSTTLDYQRRTIGLTQKTNYYHSTIDNFIPWNYWLSRTSMQLNLDLTSVFWVRLRSDAVYDSWNKQLTFEPGLFIDYEKWSLDMRLNSMMVSPELYFYSNKQELSRVRSANLSLAYRNNNFAIEGFYHVLYDVPYHQELNTFYSDLNNQDIGFTSEILETSEAFVYGLSMDYSTLLSPSSRMKINGTILSNTSNDNESVAYDNPYNFGHIFNVQWIKTFSISDTKYFQLSTAFHHRGGSYEHPINGHVSQERGKTSYDYSIPFAERLAPYARLDLRLNYIISDNNSKQVISLDIQNVTNRLNDGYHYYDPYTEEILLKKQLGIIPILSYRREW